VIGISVDVMFEGHDGPNCSALLTDA